MLKRIGWVLLAAVWLLLVVSIGSFNSADAPSHVVAVQNEFPANLCGRAGATVAYWSYYVFGIGVWVLLAGLAALLGVTVTGRRVSHSFVRALGLLFAALAIAALQGLLLPNIGPLAGTRAGLIATIAVQELVPRFSTVGTFLVLLGAAVVGGVVAVDKLMFAIPKALWMSITATGRGAANSVQLMKQLSLRPEKSSPGNVKLKPKAAKATSKKKSKSGGGDGAIDPDAGGIGATEAFDPEEHELEDEYEDDEEYEDDDEYEYEDEDEDDAEYVDEDDEEYEDEDEDEYEDDEEYEDEEEDEVRPAAKQRLTTEELKEKIAKLPVRLGNRTKTIARDEDIPRQESFENYKFPTLELLEHPDAAFSEKMEQMVRTQAEHLEEALQTFGIDGEVAGIESGPTVTLYSVQLAPGTKVARVSAVSKDLARALRAQSIRIVPNMAGKTTIGIEVPNLKMERVRLKELMSGGHAANMQLPMFLGKDAAGEPLVADLTRMPHMLIAGTTGSGKSVCMNTIIMSWLYTKRPNELKLVLVDPKMVELSQFAEIPHLMCPVVTEMGRAAAILEWAVNKMEERYELLREAQVRDILSYNALPEEELYELFQPASDEERARIPKKLPYIVFVIDELADMILTHKEVEHFIVRIAQKARAVGIHLIVATQRPQANVVTGLIKSNMPCRASFKVASGMDSRIVLDQKGAELLLGQGDMLFLSPHTTELRRAQGTLVTDGEIRKVARFLREVAAPSFERSLLAIRPGGGGGEDGEGDSDFNMAERDPMFDKAVEIMIESGRGSVSLLQRRLAIGYSRASRLVDQMGQAGILGEHRGSVARDVLISMDDWQRMKEMELGDGEAGGEYDDDVEVDASGEYADAPFDDDEDFDGEEPEIQTLGSVKQRKAAG